MFLVLAIVIAGGVFAQEWYNSYAPGVDTNRVFVNAGIGLGPNGGYSMGIPPISASVDVKLPLDFPITVGAIGTFGTWKYSTSIPAISNSNTNVTYTNLGIGARGMYHFNFIQNLDTYAGLTLGYVIQTVKATYGTYYDTTPRTGYSGSSFFLWGLNIGARYFFTDMVGAYLELGYSGLQYGGLGVTVKF